MDSSGWGMSGVHIAAGAPPPITITTGGPSPAGERGHRSPERRRTDRSDQGAEVDVKGRSNSILDRRTAPSTTSDEPNERR